MEDLTGKQLGQYQLVAPLGEGGMAVVYKAYQPSMERYVALKILPRYFAAEPDFARRFKQEAKIIASLEHPNILPVYDYGEADGYTYLVMRYVEGGKTLADLMRGQLLPLSKICDILSKLSAALDYAHSRGVVHRDIKPSNVLIDQQGNLLLSDFGLAKVFLSPEKYTTGGAFIGTPVYASPEQCMGHTDLDGRSDVYSLGVVLYEMITGRPPFEAETPMAIVLKHINDPLPMPRKINPALPESVERVALKVLAKDPGNRYQTAGELAGALQAAVTEASRESATGISSKLPLPIVAEIKRRPISTWKWAMGCLAIISVLTIIGIAIWVSTGLKPIQATPTVMVAGWATVTPRDSVDTVPTIEATPSHVAASTTWTASPPIASPTPLPNMTLTPTASVVTPTFSILPEVPEGQPHPVVAIGPDSQIHLAWADSSSGTWEVYYARSTDGGATFSQPLPVASEATGVLREHPALAIDPAGRIHIAWEDGRNSNRDVYYAYSADGTIFSPAIRVNDDTTQSDQTRPALAVGRDGAVYLVWQDNRNGDWDIYSARSPGGGDIFGANVRVNVETHSQQVDPAIGVDSQGRTHIAWASDQSGDWRVYYAYSEGERFSRGRIVGNGLISDLFSELPSLAVGSNDAVHVAWANAYVMHPDYGVPLYLPVYAVSIDGGNTFSDPRQVGEGYRYVSVRLPETGLAADNNAVHAVFTTYSPRDGSWVWYYRSSDGGLSFSAGVGVTQAQGGDVMHYPAVAVDGDGRIHIVWAHQRGDEWDVYYAQSTDGGATFSTGRKISGGE